MSCSVLILTKDEAKNIESCIRSANFSDDIVVFDSYSTDDTTELARKAGARVYQHPFESYGAQREAARRQVEYKYPWVLALDADERVDAELGQEIPLKIASSPSDLAAYRVRRKDFFRKKWIRHATLYPSWHVRLYQHERIRYPERAVHEYPDVEGGVGTLEGHLLHDNFSKGIAQWWSRHVHYAELEAAEMASRSQSSGVDLTGCLSQDPVVRRRALKSLSYKLPFRPELRYLYMMLVRGGALDGPVGWEYCRMIAEYQRIADQILRDTDS